MVSSRDWWPWTKPGYITMTRRQSNNEWSGDIAAYPAPKNYECKNPLEKFSPRFFGIKTASSSLIIFQRAKLSTRCSNYLCWCNWNTFWSKNSAGRSPMGSCSCMTTPSSPGTCNPEETHLPGLPMSWPPTLFSGSGPVGLPPVPWTKKKRIEIFRPTRRHSCRGDLVGRTTFWILFDWLAKVRSTGKEVYWSSWRICWINPVLGRCGFFPSCSG